MREFDESLRNSPEWADWEGNKAQVYVLVDGERRYPPKKIVSMATGMPVSKFSGGPETNSFLEQRGFKVERLRNHSLSDLLRLILERYAPARSAEQFEDTTRFENCSIRHDVISASSPVSSRPHLHVHASYGKGKWSTIPWISILDDRETTTTQDGTYVVYLFRDDGEGCYLKLGQGVTKLERELGVKATVELGGASQRTKDTGAGPRWKGFDLSGNTDLSY